MPCPEEDYNTVVEASATERTSAEIQVGIEETSLGGNTSLLDVGE